MKNTLKSLILCLGGLFLLGSLSINNVSFAEPVISEQILPEPEKQTTQPTKENFIKAWENNLKNLPTTVTFEKTDKPNIYTYETTLFPYNGRLRLNNIIIDRKLNYYYDYDLGVENAIKGAAEITLLNLSNDDLYKKYPLSQQIWQKDHFLFFDDSSGTWLNARQWKKARAIPGMGGDAYGAYGSYDPSCGSWCQILKSILLTTWPFLLLLIFLLIILSKTKKEQKKHMEKFDLSMERQLESIEIQKQSIELQKKQLEILQQKDQS